MTDTEQSSTTGHSTALDSAVESAVGSETPESLIDAALALFAPMNHGSPSRPDPGHKVEVYCPACLSVRAKRTAALRRALVAEGILPAVTLRAPEPDE